MKVIFYLKCYKVLAKLCLYICGFKRTFLVFMLYYFELDYLWRLWMNEWRKISFDLEPLSLSLSLVSVTHTLWYFPFLFTFSYIHRFYLSLTLIFFLSFFLYLFLSLFLCFFVSLFLSLFVSFFLSQNRQSIVHSETGLLRVYLKGLGLRPESRETVVR